MRGRARKSLAPTSELFPACAKHHLSESDILNHVTLAFADEVEGLALVPIKERPLFLALANM
jgi:hypothetical protein